ncbi:MAG TPA: hypothetical protein VFU32_01735 [Ktedonobacterales bacterium]|nr:hypothetical protein [Ktedonobacterales bacterium]
MFWQLSLVEALEASPTRKAYRVGSPSGVWVVEWHADASCTLSYYPDAPPGAPPEPMEHWSFSTLERLIQETERIPAAHVIHTDWYPDDGDF